MTFLLLTVAHAGSKGSGNVSLNCKLDLHCDAFICHSSDNLSPDMSTYGRLNSCLAALKLLLHKALL